MFIAKIMDGLVGRYRKPAIIFYVIILFSSFFQNMVIATDHELDVCLWATTQALIYLFITSFVFFVIFTVIYLPFSPGQMAYMAKRGELRPYKYHEFPLIMFFLFFNFVTIVMLRDFGHKSFLDNVTPCLIGIVFVTMYFWKRLVKKRKQFEEYCNSLNSNL